MPRPPRKLHPALTIALLAVFGAAVGAWALVEARSQRAETAEVLAAQARGLAGTLGPSLGAAAAATRELDELLTNKLLASAQLVARLQEAGILDREDLERIVDGNDLETVFVVDRNGSVVLRAGEDVPPAVLDQIADAVDGLADDLVLVPSMEDGIEHLGAASAIAGGGAVLVRIHADSGRTFAAQIGVDNLLARLLGSGGVLYLSYREHPAGIRGEATWDGGAVPPPAGSPSELREIRGRTVFEVDVPVSSPAGTDAFLRVGLDGAPLVRAAASAMRRTALIGIVLVVFSVSLGGAALVVRRRAADREEAERRLAEVEAARKRSERLAAAGALAAGLAHEVRSPLNAIGLAAQRIERNSTESACTEFARTIRSEVRRLEAVLHQFLELARPVGDERRRTDLRELSEDVRALLREEADQVGARIEPVRGEGTAAVDRESIRRALINLVQNAVAASHRGGAIELVVREEAGGAGIHVLDRGSGIDESEADRLFDAFVTTRAGGTGLGLALVKRVAEEHGGSCRLTRRPDGGTEAILWLPPEGGSR